MQLKIPTDQIPSVREIVRASGGKILFDPDDETWHYVGTKLPTELQKYAATTKTQTWLLDVPFADKAKASALGARWKGELKAWTYEGTNLPLDLQGYLPLPYSWEERQLTLIQGNPPVRKPQKEIILRPHQIEATKAIVAAFHAKQSGFLLADDVGLGKTYSTWAAVLKCCTKQDILIVAPVGVLPVWRQAILDMGDGGHRVLIINYDKLKKLFELEPGKKVKSLKGLARRGTSLAFDITIWDEAHYLRSMEGPKPAARAKLADKIYSQCPFHLWLSATAGQNVLELGYLKPILLQGQKNKDLLSWCEQQGFEVQRGEFGKLIWEPSPQEEAKLNHILFRQKPLLGMRRLPQQVANWPELQRILFPVELDQEQHQLYQLAWKEFIQAMALDRKAGKITTNGLTAALRLRQKASLLKVQATVDLVETLVDSGRRVPVSVEFLDSLEAVGAELKKRKITYTQITGQTPDREERRVSFQSGHYDVILFTPKEGISLHQGQILGAKDRPRTQVVHDLRWSGIDQHQIDGRSHRDGQFCPIYWMILKETIEERVGKRLLAKMGGMAGILGDTKDMLNQILRELED